jgi:hypothetical protein
MGLRQWTRQLDRPNGDEITAAATVYDHSRQADQKRLASSLLNGRIQAAQVWEHHDEIGEIHYAVGRTARIAGYARPMVREILENGEIGDEVTTGPEAEFVAGLYSPFGGRREFISRFVSLMKITADAYLIRVRDDNEVDGWHFASSSELSTDSHGRPAGGSSSTTTGVPDGKIRWTLAPGGASGADAFTRDIDVADVIGRIWMPSTRWVEVADSPLAAMNIECTALRILTQVILAKLRSRLALAGIMFFPDSIRDVRVAGMPTGSNLDFLNFLGERLGQNVVNHTTAQAILPLLMQGPGEAGEKIRHIFNDENLDEQQLALRNELIGRILFGLDIQQGATRGGADQNHWNAWNQADEERRIAVAPDLDMLGWAITRMGLLPHLLEAKVPNERILRRVITFDLTDAATRFNQQEDTRQAYDRGAANPESVRRTAGLRKEDALTGVEYVQWVGRDTKQPRLALWGTPEYDQIPWDEIEVSKTGPAPDTGGDKPESAPGVGDPGAPNGGPPS